MRMYICRVEGMLCGCGVRDGVCMSGGVQG